MKMPLYQPLCPGDIGGIVRLALFELGLDEAFLLEAFVRAGGKPRFKRKSGEWLLDRIGVSEWMWICDLLYLPADCISYGYCRREHQFRVGKSASEGSYVLPMTESARSLIREYYRNLKQNIRDESNHYGDPLLTRIRRERYRETIARRFERRKKRLTLRSTRLRMLLARHIAEKKTRAELPKTTPVPKGLTTRPPLRNRRLTELNQETRTDG